jgi:hypothetical protein
MNTDPSGQFSDWLAEHRSGSLDDELTAALVELAEKVVLEAVEIEDRTGIAPLWTT